MPRGKKTNLDLVVTACRASRRKDKTTTVKEFGERGVSPGEVRAAEEAGVIKLVDARSVKGHPGRPAKHYAVA
jgi:hypothetical protein